MAPRAKASPPRRAKAQHGAATPSRSTKPNELAPVRLDVGQDGHDGHPQPDGPNACTPHNLLQYFKRGEVCTLPASELLPPEILRLSLDVLREEHGDSHIVRTMAQFLLPQYKHLPLDQWPPDAKKCCEAPRPTFRAFIDDLEQHEANWKPDATYRGLARGRGCSGLLSACYGVANVKQLRGLERVSSRFFAQQWYHAFNFVWLGWSPGGLHFDEMDNVLVQLAGTKEIVIFPPHVTELIDGAHYPGSGKGPNGRPAFSGKGFFSEEAMASHPVLAAMPYYHVKLAAGDAVSIPSGAYHAPLATSHDSVSINSFLAPSLWRASFPSFWRGQFWTMAGIYRYLGAYFGWVWRWFGVSLIKAGAYDYL